MKISIINKNARFALNESSDETKMSSAEKGSRSAKAPDVILTGMTDSPRDKVWVCLRDGRPHVIDIDLIMDTMGMIMQDLSDNYPDIAAVITRAPILYVSHPKVRTMATDGESIFISPAWAESMLLATDLPNDIDGSNVLEFAIIHEVFHILFRHVYHHQFNHDRYPDNDMANIAQDYEINYVIGNFLREDHGAVSGFDDAAKCGRFMYDEKYATDTWQEIYDKLNSDEIEKLPKGQLTPAQAEAFKKEYERLYNEKVASGELK